MEFRAIKNTAESVKPTERDRIDVFGRVLIPVMI